MVKEQIKMQDEKQREVYVELLKLKCVEQQKLASDFQKAALFYLAIVGTILKFALDKNATPELKQALSFLGLAISFLAFLACFFIERLRLTLDTVVSELNASLGKPLSHFDNKPLRYQRAGAACTVFVVCCGFIYLLFI